MTVDQVQDDRNKIKQNKRQLIWGDIEGQQGTIGATGVIMKVANV